MKAAHLALFSVFVLAIGIFAFAEADDDEYHYLSICDSRCEIGNRVNPFAESCDNCCRVRGFRKGKCKGFGWRYCACKPHGLIRSILTNMLNGNVNHHGQNQGLNNVFQG